MRFICTFGIVHKGYGIKEIGSEKKRVKRNESDRKTEISMYLECKLKDVIN